MIAYELLLIIYFNFHINIINDINTTSEFLFSNTS